MLNSQQIFNFNERPICFKNIIVLQHALFHRPLFFTVYIQFNYNQLDYVCGQRLFSAYLQKVYWNTILQLLAYFIRFSINRTGINDVNNYMNDYGNYRLTHFFNGMT